MMTSRATFGVTNPATGKTLGEGFGVGSQAVVHFIDVGQGDAILVVTPAGNALLVDAGPSGAAASLLAYVAALELEDIDVAVVSHAHADHVGGMDEVLNTFTVGAFYDTAYQYDSVGYRSLVDLVQAKGISFVTTRAGMMVPLDPWVDVRILHPAALGTDCNNNSIALKVTYGDVDFVLAGGAEAEAEGAMLTQIPSLLAAEILKVGHHGSSTSSSSTFLSAVSPEVAVISVGAGNTYGHPTEATLTRLSGAGATVYRTDLNGTITMSTDGRTYTVVPANGTPVTGVAAGGTTPPPASTQYTISAAASPSAGGTVSGAGTYAAGQSVTLQATPASGYRFVRWEEGSASVSTSASYTFTAAANRTLIAKFELIPTYSYIGNKDTKKFHRLSCNYLPDPQNRVYFTSREEAINAGYVPCGHCKP